MSDLDLEFIDSGKLCSLEGYSDFSEVAANTANALGAVIKDRLSSMVNEGLFTSKINSFIAKIVALIPPQIDIGESLYLDGWLYKGIITTPQFV